ncbi:hypothetical protein Patl1_02010 [Pistacia atlantica]|uniref:Uncharacterized protein n=1 Tax=Pistacia atlantica TaxID=434234 RepID=A0ACC1C4M7_9ROSI|nr:hypothetical protein Patl1_02010 [Pistacia atlantica]
MVSSGGAASDGEVTGSKRCSQNLKKGPWTAAEDAILMEYVKKHGEGNWNAVQKNSGLMRCGKSCRLRWANHLRPNLKKGSFTPEEERIIIELHAKLGNKWARMAAQAQPRTSASTGSTAGVCAMKTNADHKIIPPKTTRGNSGLLDALVQESQKLSRNEIFKGENLSAVGDKGKGVVGVPCEEEEGNEGVDSVMRNSGEANADTLWDDLSSSQSSIGMKAGEEPLEEMNSMDDDLMTLLNNFPLSMPLPEWYPGNSEISNGSSTTMTGGSNVDTNHQQNAATTIAPPSVASPDLQWSLGSCGWNNMPSIC